MLLGLGGAAGVALSWGYYLEQVAAFGVPFLAVAPVVVTAVFLLVAPTSRLAWASASPQATARPGGEPAPVVMIVFDEFPVASLLDGEGNIQAEHFQLRRLAADGTWFRNAVGVHQQTEKAIPTILTGVWRPLSGKVPVPWTTPTTSSPARQRVPSRGGGDLTEFPSRVRLRAGGSRERYRSTFGGPAWAGTWPWSPGHVLLPDDLTASLPAIDQGWGNFGSVMPPGRSRSGTTRSASSPTSAPTVATRVAHFSTASITRWPTTSSTSPTCSCPIGPGATSRRARVRGHRPYGQGSGWLGRGCLAGRAVLPEAPDTGQYVDRLLRDLIDRLESHDSYDDTLIVIVADHVDQRPARAAPEVHHARDHRRHQGGATLHQALPTRQWRGGRLPGGNHRCGAHHRRRARHRPHGGPTGCRCSLRIGHHGRRAP